jgi:hypothetical protein
MPGSAPLLRAAPHVFRHRADTAKHGASHSQFKVQGLTFQAILI